MTRTQRKEQLTPRKQTMVGDGFPEEMLSMYEFLDDRWMRRLHQAEAGRKERVFLAARRERGWQVWEAVTEYDGQSGWCSSLSKRICFCLILSLI